jgi:hypothetical protein
MADNEGEANPELTTRGKPRRRRPRTRGGSTETCSVSFNTERLRRAREIAALRGVSFSLVADEALEMWLGEIEAAAEDEPADNAPLAL